jgi:hypothetical protein
MLLVRALNRLAARFLLPLETATVADLRPKLTEEQLDAIGSWRPPPPANPGAK